MAKTTTHGSHTNEVVDRPNYYMRFKIEPTLFIEENKLSFMQGNIIKYVCRYDAKNGVQDLQKAKRYLEMLIAKVEGQEDWNL